ncbi:hypothetical protein [Tahibacter harae]|uniref:Uncharacterized protein n=1 Tax=Tahibacter harae TaxID=2963937 RepID=A0ABT1QQL4_9GAMM|nr:hypothetical protein [Tahibacter harae]MCQ4164560.1 hypothetical protein [Tahibacter harae]
MSEDGAAQPQVLVRAAAPLQLGPAAVERELAGAVQAAALVRQLQDAAPGREVYLVLDGLRVEADPGVLYQVELVSLAAPGAAPEAAGSFSLYGVAHASGASARRSFAVTAAVRRLAARGGFALRLRPSGAAAPGAKVEIGQICLVLQ